MKARKVHFAWARRACMERQRAQIAETREEADVTCHWCRQDLARVHLPDRGRALCGAIGTLGALARDEAQATCDRCRYEQRQRERRRRDAAERARWADASHRERLARSASQVVRDIARWAECGLCDRAAEHLDALLPGDLAQLTAQQRAIVEPLLPELRAMVQRRMDLAAKGEVIAAKFEAAIATMERRSAFSLVSGGATP